MLTRIARFYNNRKNRLSKKVSGWYNFLTDYSAFKKQTPAESEFPIIGFYPFILDRYAQSGNFCQHYFEQDLLMAQRIFANRPAKHIDIGSRVDGFVTHVAAFRDIEIFDIRPLSRSIQNVTFRQADLMQLPSELHDYTDSISSLHVIEHFGLGRYGDPIDVNGHLKALDNIYRILKPGGRFYFSAPVGKQGVMFNAHRLFNVTYLVGLFEKKYKLDKFYLIDDQDVLFHNLDFRSPEAQNSFGCAFGCAIFELIKL